MAEVRRLASLGLAKRAEAGIKVRQPLNELRIANSKSQIVKNKQLLEILKDEVNVKEIKFDPKIPSEVELDTLITPELKEEGIMRGLKRTVQELRQEAGLRPGESIELFLDLTEELKSIVSKNEKFLKSEVSAKTVNYNPVRGRPRQRASSTGTSGRPASNGVKKSDKFSAESETKIDGVPVWVGVKKIR